MVNRPGFASYLSKETEAMPSRSHWMIGYVRRLIKPIKGVNKVASMRQKPNQQRRKNLTIASALVALAVLMFLVTIVKLEEQVH